MARISTEEKRREASDWLTGLIGVALVLIALILGYMAYKGTIIHRQSQQMTQNGCPVNPKTASTENTAP